MTFFLDHDAPHDLTYSLRALGHEVVALRDVLPITVDDATVLRYAAEHGYVIITCNREDFVVEAQNIPMPASSWCSAARPAAPNEPPSSSSSTAPVRPA
jgi:predicted nuclease of predicted toxin-antitoxin system